MKAGKALHRKRAEIRVQFRHVPGNLYKRSFGTDLDQATNELVTRFELQSAFHHLLEQNRKGSQTLAKEMFLQAGMLPLQGFEVNYLLCTSFFYFVTQIKCFSQSLHCKLCLKLVLAVVALDGRQLYCCMKSMDQF